MFKNHRGVHKNSTTLLSFIILLFEMEFIYRGTVKLEPSLMIVENFENISDELPF